MDDDDYYYYYYYYYIDLVYGAAVLVVPPFASIAAGLSSLKTHHWPHAHVSVQASLKMSRSGQTYLNYKHTDVNTSPGVYF
jgi:hypothetical protein